MKLLQLPPTLLALASLISHTSADVPFSDLKGLTTLNEDHSGRNGDDPAKYFHESTFHPHYDGRFTAAEVAEDERIPALRALVQTYLATMHDIGANTWIMHGSLLGWWWNAKVMPWDTDIDVQIDERGIKMLGDFYNMTVWSFPEDKKEGDQKAQEQRELKDRQDNEEGKQESSENGIVPKKLSKTVWDPAKAEENSATLPAVGKKYLLEINPHYTNPSTTDRANVIDARWIDVSNGLFIDITTLRPYNASTSDLTLPVSTSTTSRIQAALTHRKGEDPWFYSKDRHTFRSSQIFPLRESAFENYPVKIPYAYSELLEEEYGAKALTQRQWEGHVFDGAEWVKIKYPQPDQPQQFEQFEQKENEVPRTPSQGANIPDPKAEGSAR